VAVTDVFSLITLTWTNDRSQQVNATYTLNIIGADGMKPSEIYDKTLGRAAATFGAALSEVSVTFYYAAEEHEV
jgi:hypothetical protein